MLQAGMAFTTSDRLKDLAGRLERHAGFAEVVASLQAGHAATLDGVWGSSCALAAATLARHAPATLVVLCPHGDDVDDLLDDLPLFSDIPAERFPAWEALPNEQAAVRRSFRRPLAGAEIAAIVRPAEARRGEHSKSLAAGARPADACPANANASAWATEIRVEELARWLVENGFQNMPAVELPGEFSIRGGIMDIFAPDWFDPVRVEFFGDEIESLRRFEIASQRSLGTLEEIELTILPSGIHERAHFSDYLPPQSWFLLIEPMELEQQGRHYLERLDRPAELHDVSSVLREAFRFPSVAASAVAAGSLETTCRLKIESVERFSGDINRIREELDDAGAGQEVFVVCQTEAEAKRLGDLFAGTEIAQAGSLHFPIGALHNGFRLVTDRIVLLKQRRTLPPHRSPPAHATAVVPGDRQLFGTARKRSRGPRRRTASAAIAA